MFKTPFGNPASVHISPKRRAVIGVISLGFATKVFPAARAGAIFHENKYSGRFHGEIQPTTPIGWRNVKLMVFKPTLSCASLANCVMAFPKKRKFAEARGISTAKAKLNGLPLSFASASARSTNFSSIKSAIFRRILLRSSMVMLLHFGNASFAAWYAFSISAALVFAICEYTSPVDGL